MSKRWVYTRLIDALAASAPERVPAVRERLRAVEGVLPEALKRSVPSGARIREE